MFILIIFYIYQSESKDVVYFPTVCAPLPEELELCVGETISTNLFLMNTENDPLVCTDSTSQENCYLETNSTDISISPEGIVTYTGTYRYDVVVYDFTDALGVRYDSDNYQCLQCPPNCSDCINLQCYVPFIGHLVSDIQQRLAFELFSSTNIEIQVLNTGYFLMTPNCTSSQQVITWSIQVSDKLTNRKTILDFGSFYPNTIPEFLYTNSNYSLYNSLEFNASFAVTDSNHLLNELHVWVPTSEFYLVQDNGIFYLQCQLSLLPGTYNVSVFVNDTGIDGVNPMQNTFVLYLDIKNSSEFLTLSDSLVTVVKYSGDWFYFIPGADAQLYYFYINTFNTGIVVIDSNSGVLYWTEDEISKYNSRSYIIIQFQLVDNSCNCYPINSEIDLRLEVIDPPIIFPPDPIYSVYNCSIEFELNISFKYPELLTYTFTGFELLDAPEILNNTFYWATPVAGMKKDYNLTITSTYTDNNMNKIESSTIFYINLRPNIIFFSSIPESNRVVVLNNTYTLNISNYINYDFLKHIQYDISSDIPYSFIDGVFVISPENLQNALQSSYDALVGVTVTAVGLCFASTFTSFDVLILSESPTATIPTSFYCAVHELCEISLIDYIKPSADLITDYSYAGLPIGMNTSVYNMSWLPAYNIAYGGDIKFSITIERVTLISNINIYILRKLAIESFTIDFYQAVVNEPWSYNFNVVSYEGLEFECTNQDLSNIDKGPVYNNLSLYWDPVENSYNDTYLTAYTGNLSCAYKAFDMTSYVVYTINLIQRCQFAELENTQATVGQEWTSSLTVYNLSQPHLTVTKNRPFSFSVNFIAQAAETLFLLKWTPNVTGLYWFELQCQNFYYNYTVYPGLIPITNAKNVTIFISQQSLISNIIVYVYVLQDWVGNIPGSNLDSCDTSASGLQNISVLVADGACVLVSPGAALYGVNETLTIQLELYNVYASGQYLDFSLYPNDIPVLVSPTNYSVPIGRVPFELNLEVKDSEGLAYKLISCPSGMTISDTGFINWITPDEGVVPSYTTVLINVTNINTYPCTIQVNLTLMHLIYLPPPQPVCPGLVPLEVNSLWTWDTNSNRSVQDYELIDPPDGMNISDTGIISFMPYSAGPTPLVTVLHRNIYLAEGLCNFTLYPNYRPVIQPASLDLIEGTPWYYRLNLSNLNEDVGGFTIVLLNSPNFISLNDTYGLLYGLLTDYAYNGTSAVLQITVEVTNNLIFFSLSATQTFNLTVKSIEHKPVFVLNDSQILLDTLVEGQYWELVLEVYDKDTPYSQLQISVDYNPWSISIAQNATNLNLFTISWTPPNLVTSSGLMTLTLFETYNPYNNNSIDLIMYSIAQIDNPPVFLTALEDIIITDKDNLEVLLNIDDVDSLPSDICINVTGTQGTGLMVMGLDALVRNSAPLADDLVATIQVIIYNDLSNYNSANFTLTIKHTNDPPVFTQAMSESFEYYNFTHKGAYKLIALDPEGDYYTFCVIEGEDITIENDYIVWNNVPTDQVYKNFTVAVTDQGDCETMTSFNSVTLTFCQCLDCCYLPTGVSVISINETTLCIDQESVDYVYIGSNQCLNFTSKCCSIPLNYHIYNFSLYLQNSYGLSPGLPTGLSIPGEGLNISIWPDFFYGTGNEIITVKSTIVTNYWNCWIVCNMNTTELIFYANMPYDMYGYCLLPYIEYNNDTECSLVVCDTSVISESCTYNSLYLWEQPYFNATGLSGHEEGGYILDFSVNFGNWVSRKVLSPYILFGGVVLSPMSFTSNQIKLRIPPKKDSSAALLYISPVYPYVWGSEYTIFNYTVSCMQPGYYCNDNNLTPCPAGHSCPITSSMLIYPIPCTSGTYQSYSNASYCDICSQGFMCPYDGMTSMHKCQAGFICSQKMTSYPYMACPPGYYCNEGTDTQVVSEGQNYYELRSDGAFYSSDHWIGRGKGFGTDLYSGSFTPECISEHLDNNPGTTPPLSCSNQYFCLLGVNTSDSALNTWFSPQKCENGYLCTENDGEMFNNTKTCNIGYFCPNATVAKYCNNNTECFKCECPSGYSCPFQGMVEPTICTAGYYQPRCGQSVCIECDQGYYCSQTGTDQQTIFMQLCPPGYYCIQGSTDKTPCTPGYYNSEPGQSSCQLCSRGHYCFQEALTTQTKCDEGFMCTTQGLDVPVVCIAGHYCLAGVSYFTQLADCPDGEVCPTVCPIGHKCPLGSKAPAPCPGGTYQPEEGQTDCISCAFGYYCPDTGLSSMKVCPAGYYCNLAELLSPAGQCPAGYYCLEGTINSTSSLDTGFVIFDCDSSVINITSLVSQPIPCPKGTYCPLGTGSDIVESSIGPKLCTPGSYNDRCAQGQCIACPSGFYCNETGMVNPVLCPLGMYRSGYIVLCESCAPGKWANGKQGLTDQSECSPCPAGYYCDESATANYSQMKPCTSGFYCPEGTIRPRLQCPSGYFCPAGTDSLETVLKNYLCPPGFFCPSQTIISAENFDECKGNFKTCIAGKICPVDSYCPAGTTDMDIKTCPEGTISEPGIQDISSCQKNPNSPPKIYASANILDKKTAKELNYVSLNPMEYAYFLWNTSLYPNGNIPTDYIPYAYIQETKEKIPFIQQQPYKPINRIPVASIFSDYLSVARTYTFVILAHQTSTIKLMIDTLNGLYSEESYLVTFANSISLISINSTSRNLDTQFLSVLSRTSSAYFDDPININIHSVLPSDPSKYGTYSGTLVPDVSISMLSELDHDTEFYPQSDIELWDKLEYGQKLYPMDYLPYVTDCDDYGAFIPMYQLYTHSQCEIVPKLDTKTVNILNPTRLPYGDSCDIKLKCKIAEKIDSSAKPWFSAYELSSSFIFYITRPQVSNFVYENAIPDSKISSGSFNQDYYGSGNLIPVQAYRGSSTYATGMIPRNVKLELGYYQRTLGNKEILQAKIYFSNFDSEVSNTTYEFNFVFYALSWKECLDLFAFDDYLYYIFISLVCLGIFLIVIIFWLINYVRSPIWPRPRLRIKLYLRYSLRAFLGIIKGVVLVFTATVIFYYSLQSASILKQITGDYDDNYPISFDNLNDTQRINKYLNGRFGTCIIIFSWYLILKSAYLLFPTIEKADHPKDIILGNIRNQKLKSLYLWNAFPIIILGSCYFLFSESDVFITYQTLFLFAFKILNGRVIENTRVKFNDNLYILPFLGALNLVLTLVTVKVGAFTSFLTGYLTNIAIKIFTRAFIEPYRIEITNKILSFKKKYRLGGSAEVSQGLGFKDRVYIEQINDLGANSMELVSSILFPAMIVFNYLFYDVLELTIPKTFLIYFIAFSLIQAFAEIGYDVFLNNAIECKTGRLLSEKIVELKRIFDERETDWALASILPHSGRRLIEEIDNMLRFGFSSQYFYTMTVGILGIVMQIYGVDIWVLASYNPFKDFISLFLVIFIPFGYYLLEKSFNFGVKVVWKRKTIVNKSEDDGNFYKMIKFYVGKELETQVSTTKSQILVKAIVRAIHDKYNCGINEKKRMADISRLIKSLEDACKIGKVPLENLEKIEDFPLPNYKPKTMWIKIPPTVSIKSKLKPKQGYWPSHLIYPWST